MAKLRPLSPQMRRVRDAVEALAKEHEIIVLNIHNPTNLHGEFLKAAREFSKSRNEWGASHLFKLADCIHYKLLLPRSK